MVTIQLWGKEFPLCLTVAALDRINEKCGGINELMTFLQGGPDKDYSKMIVNTAWTLAVLMEEGEENRLVCSRFDSSAENAVRRAVPDQKALLSGLTIASTLKYHPAVISAVSESMAREIEAVYSKKKENEEEQT